MPAARQKADTNNGDGDDDDAVGNNKHLLMQPRKLISQYLAKTCPPPAMLKPTFSAVEMNPQMELAYKHPIFLMEPGMSNSSSTKTDVESIMHEKNKEVEIVEIKYIDEDESIQKSSAVDDANNRKNLNMVGKISPNIIKTWEQLSGNALKTRTSTTTTTTLAGAGRTETNCILFHRKTYDGREGKFFQPSPQQQTDTLFFDSIDAPTSLMSSVDIDDYDVTCNEKYIISCRNYDQAMMDSTMLTMTSAAMPSGGEGMAELDSLDRTQMQWSIDK